MGSSCSGVPRSGVLTPFPPASPPLSITPARAHQTPGLPWVGGGTSGVDKDREATRETLRPLAGLGGLVLGWASGRAVAGGERSEVPEGLGQLWAASCSEPGMLGAGETLPTKSDCGRGRLSYSWKAVLRPRDTVTARRPLRLEANAPPLGGTTEVQRLRTASPGTHWGLTHLPSSNHTAIPRPHLPAPCLSQGSGGDYPLGVDRLGTSQEAWLCSCSPTSGRGKLLLSTRRGPWAQGEGAAVTPAQGDDSRAWADHPAECDEQSSPCRGQNWLSLLVGRCNFHLGKRGRRRGAACRGARHAHPGWIGKARGCPPPGQLSSRVPRRSACLSRLSWA